MKLRQFLEQLAVYAKNSPEMLDKDVVFSADDEGNSYGPVIFSPTKGFYSDETGFCDHEHLPDDEVNNATCIN